MTTGSGQHGDDAPASPAEASGSEFGLRGRIRRWLGAPGTQRRVLARNAIWNWAAFVLNALTIYFLSPYIVRTLGKTPYGYWEAVIQLLGYLGFADFGVRPAIVHFVARHDALREKAQVNRYVNTAFVTLAAGSIFVFAATAICAPMAPRWFDVPEAMHSETVWATFIVGLTFTFSLPLNAFSAVLIGKQRFDLSCRVDVALIVIRTVAVVGTLMAGWGLVGLAVAHALTTWIEMIWKTALAYRVEPRLRFAPKLAKRSHAKGLLTFGGYNIVVAMAMRLTYQTDALVIGAQMSLAAVALFSFGAKLASYTRDMLFTVGRVLTPAMGALEAKGPESIPAVAGLLVASMRNMLLLSVPLLLYWTIFGGAFLEAWLEDRSFRDEGALPLTILALGALAPIASYPIVAIHWGTNRMRSLAVFSGIEGAMNLGLSLWLVQDHGLAGVALGTAIPGFLIHGLVMPWWIARSFELRLGRLLWNGTAVPLLAGGLTAVAALQIVHPDGDYGWPMLIGSGMALVAVYAACAWILVRVLRPGASDGRVLRGAPRVEDAF